MALQGQSMFADNQNDGAFGCIRSDGTDIASGGRGRSTSSGPVTGLRAGNINPLLYLLFNTAPGYYFHDITGIGPAQQAATTNGLFPTTPGYDLATGIGTSRMTELITRSGP